MSGGFATARLEALPMGPADAEDLHTVWGDPEVIFWGAHADLDATRSFLVVCLARSAAGPPLGWFGLRRRTDGAFLGDVVLQPAPWDAAVVEIGWHLARDAQGDGYATEAARGALAHAAAHGVAEVEAIVLPSNAPSQAVARRIGLVPTGTTVDREAGTHNLWRGPTTRP